METTTEMPAGDKTVFATVFTPAEAAEGGVQVVSNVFQVADDEPMQSPPRAARPSAVPARSTRASSSASTRSACASGRSARGTTATSTAYGEQVDFWIDDSVGPIGLIKLEAEQKQHPTIRAGFKFELVATGNERDPADHQAGACRSTRRC